MMHPIYQSQLEKIKVNKKYKRSSRRGGATTAAVLTRSLLCLEDASEEVKERLQVRPTEQLGGIVCVCVCVCV